MLILALHLDKSGTRSLLALVDGARICFGSESKRVSRMDHDELMYLYVILYVIYMRSDQSTGFNNNYIKICLLMVLFAVSGRL